MNWKPSFSVLWNSLWTYNLGTTYSLKISSTPAKVVWACFLGVFCVALFFSVQPSYYLLHFFLWVVFLFRIFLSGRYTLVHPFSIISKWLLILVLIFF